MRIFSLMYALSRFTLTNLTPCSIRAQFTRSNTRIQGIKLSPGPDLCVWRCQWMPSTVVDPPIHAGSCWATQHPSTAVIKHSPQVCTLIHTCSNCRQEAFCSLWSKLKQSIETKYQQRGIHSWGPDRLYKAHTGCVSYITKQNQVN